MYIKSSRLLNFGIVLFFVMMTAGISSAAEVNVELVGSYDVFSPSYYLDSVAISDNNAYVIINAPDITHPVIYSDLERIDISNPTRPAFKEYVDSSFAANDVALSDTHAYVADIKSLQIVPLTDFSFDYEGTYSTDNYASVSGVAVSGNYAYLNVGGSSLVILDTTNPSTPKYMGRYDTGGYGNGDAANGIAVASPYAYLATPGIGLVVVDVSSPSSPKLAGSCDIAGDARDVAVSGKYAYVISNRYASDDYVIDLDIIDITNPSSPKHVSTYFLSDIAGRYGYGYDIAVAGNYAYVADSYNGLVIVDISDPLAPTLAGSYDTAGGVKDVAVSGNNVYLAAGNSGLLILRTEIMNQITVGEGAATPEMEQLFINAYNRNGGLSVLGNPATIVHEAFGFQVQDFPGASGILGGVIMYNPSKNNAYYIHGAIWDMYYNYPNKAQLGHVADDELEAAKSPQGTTGRYTKFQTGTIHWISNGNVNHLQGEKAFATYGKLDEMYTNLRGTASDLGFPVMNQEDRNGHGYCRFEGGSIEWNDSIGNYKVKFNSDGSSTPLTITISSPRDGDSFRVLESITFRGDIIGGNSQYTYNWIIDEGNHVEVTTNLYSEFTFSYLSQDDLGEHTVKLQVSDSQGNTIESAPIKFRVVKKVAVIPAKFSDSGTVSSPSLGTLQSRIDLIQQYYSEQSYSTVPIDFDFYICNTEVDSWFKLSFLTSEFENTFDSIFDLFDSNDYSKRISMWREACGVAGINLYFSSPTGRWQATDYDTVLVLFPVDFRSEAYKYDSYAICDADENYGNWAHELGHSLFGFNDKAGDEQVEGNIGWWGLMGKGCICNPPTPIIGFDKNKAGWLQYKEISFSDIKDSGNEYTVRYLDDSKITEDGLLKLNARLESNVKYFVFEGRREKDGVKTETTSAENYPLFDGDDKGILAYQIEYKSGMDQIFRVPAPISLNRMYKLTIPVGESIKLDEGTLKATCLSDGDTLKLMLEPIKPVDLKVFSYKVTLPNVASLWHSVPDNSSLDVDLHVATNDGKHVGMNYTENVYCNEIQGAETSGNILGGGSEWISIPKNVDVMAYVTVSPDLESLLESNKSLTVNVTSALTIYGENGNMEKYEPVSIIINSEKLRSQIPISTYSNSSTSITNLQSATGINWINFTWTKPADPDFNYTEIYLNSIFQTNTTAEYFNVTGLQLGTSYTVGTRTVDINGNVSHTWVNLTATTLSDSKSGGGGGGSTSSKSGGGGGGGAGSAEDYANVAVKDVDTQYLRMNANVTYDFTKEGNPIQSVSFYSLKNSGEITSTIEVLNNRSKLVNSTPEGSIYKYVNIWVGKSGFATAANIKDAKVRFKVNSSWLEEMELNPADVKLQRYNGTAWEVLPTTIANNSTGYVIFETQTPGFSPFAITAEKVLASSTGDNIDVKSTETEDVGMNGTQPKTAPGFGFSMAILIIGVFAGGYVYLKRRQN